MDKIDRIFIAAGLKPPLPPVRVRVVDWIARHKYQTLSLVEKDNNVWDGGELLCYSGTRFFYMVPVDFTVQWSVHTRQEAMALGMTTYWPGYTCRRGHISLRATYNGGCLACRQERPEHPIDKPLVEAPWPVMTRAEAMSKGVKKYWTGKPCKHGHIAQRYTLSGICTGCHAANMKKMRNRKKELAATG